MVWRRSHEALPQSDNHESHPELRKNPALVECKATLDSLLIQELRNFAESNSTHAWAYDLCEYATVYPGHGFGDGGKQDFVEVLAGYIYEQGGEAEFLRVYEPFYTILVSIAAEVYHKDPTLLRH